MSYEGGGTIIGPTGPTGPAGSGGADWSQYPATQDVEFDGNNITNATAIYGLGGLMSSLTVIQVEGTNYLTLDANIIGGGGIGPTGATGATGGISFSGPTGAVLWFDGSAVTGTTGFTWTETGGMGNAYRLSGGPNGNFIDLDENGYMGMFIGQPDVGNAINLGAASATIGIVDRITGENPQDSFIQLASDTLTLNIASSPGTNGQVLTSGGQYATWVTPLTSIASGLAFCPTTLPSNTYFISVPAGSFITSNAIVQTTLQVPDGISQNWIVYAEPYFGPLGTQYIKVEFASIVTNSATTIAWTILARDSTPAGATANMPV